MTTCFFVSDLHGHAGRYEKLIERIAVERPEAVFVGGDILPSGVMAATAAGTRSEDFLKDFLIPSLVALRTKLGADFPRIFLILGNDDGRFMEERVRDGGQGFWEYAHGRRIPFRAYSVYGYACVPPTPFMLKDWERYDVSRYVDPGCISPEEGVRTVAASERDRRYGTIATDLEALAGHDDMARAIFLFHTPPYETALDRAGLDATMIDHVPADCHVGSIAVRRFIEARKPLVTLHGHIHESARLTGAWRDRIGRTHCFTAAHDGPELALVRFDPSRLGEATRELV